MSGITDELKADLTTWFGDRPVWLQIAAARLLDGEEVTDDKIKVAATNFVEAYRARKEPRALGHNVGLEVHDVGGLQAATFEPGRVFTIEPQLRIESEHLGIRLEDMILITETGYENLSGFVPAGVDEIERLMREPPKYLKAR